MEAVSGARGASRTSSLAFRVRRKNEGLQRIKMRNGVGCSQGRRRVSVYSQGQGGASSRKSDDSGFGSLPGNLTDIGVLNGSVNGGDLSGNDMLKLFQDAQENMLFLNKQRLIAIEELQKVERDREFLMAKVAQVEAEFNASVAARETLDQKLKVAEAALEMAESRGVSVASGAKSRRHAGKADPPSVWSNLLLRIDSMVLSGAVNLDEARALRKLVTAQDIRAAETFEELQECSDEDLKAPLMALTHGGDRSLHVMQVVTELAPVAEAGSLGPWVLGLCRALRRKGHTVEVVMPMYGTLDTAHIDCFREHPGELYSFFDGEWHRNKIWTGSVYGIPVTFIEPLHPDNFFGRDRLYGHEDDFERFTYFCRAALEYVLKLEKSPDVLHMHDWQTALVAPLFWDIYYHQGLKDTRLLFTWHDAHYQNPQPAEKLSKVGLDPGQLNRPDRLQDPRDPNLVNLLKGGVVYSNKVTTVSQQYAHDVMTPEFGCSLDETFRAHGQKIVGISSGVDESVWDPSTDSALPIQYSAKEDFLTAKAVARSELRMKLGLPLLDESTGSERPLVVCLVPHMREAELEVLQSLINTALHYGSQFVFVGASRSPKAQAALEEMQREMEDPNIKFVIHYESDLAHLALASAQILTCLSFKDPTFSFTMAGLKYGALPVSRQPMDRSSALVDVDDPQRGQSEGVGFFTATENAEELTNGLARAICYARDDPGAWEEWSRRAMSLDLSWDSASSDDYVSTYWSIYRCS